MSLDPHVLSGENESLGKNRKRTVHEPRDGDRANSKQEGSEIGLVLHCRRISAARLRSSPIVEYLQRLDTS